ncbi:phosphatase PAP2 family protein [Treponema endosymbiont of Eucomonympha sp.]|uniref:phosphatase PAP2 family protein n=1 Tax=Treponema endosymbiont of Eucomonympha sp. TaxID=1580831 RepID=UPI000750F1A6|nr:phosphatase PAP2 family protein [Treponema endosymbiont of Eucomonympha sp.]
MRWGLSVIRAVQTWEHPALRLFVACATFLGNQTTCIVCGLCVYWALSRRKGFELCVMLWATLAVNTALKGILAVPRPFVADPSVLRAAADGYSTPSSHAQLTAVFWTLAAGLVFRRLPAAARAALAVLPPLAVSVSRVALGVHYPTDVLLGLAVGYLTAAGALLFWDVAAGALGTRRTALKFLCLAAFCLALGVTATAFLRFASGAVPAFAAALVPGVRRSLP